ncbi:MAG: LemA family protein [Planctomycetota bacterium]
MSPALIAVIAIGAVLFVLALWAIGVYNRFIALRNHIRESWSGVDVELKRRYNLIPSLVNTAKGYMKHEQETLEKVIQARNTAAANHGPVDSQAKDETQLTGVLRQFFALAESYPELKADSHFLKLQEELSNTEDRIAASRRFYNGNVREFNTLRQVFPSSIIAGFGNFTAEPFFELEDEAARRMPEVAF